LRSALSRSRRIGDCSNSTSRSTLFLVLAALSVINDRPRHGDVLEAGLGITSDQVLVPGGARRVALRTALLGKLQDGETVIADLGEFSMPSSRSARKVLSDLGSPRRALIVLDQPDTNVWKSFRNFPGVKVRPAQDLCAHDVVAGGLIVLQGGALESIAARVGTKIKPGEGE
jgi:hypothetical protein